MPQNKKRDYKAEYQRRIERGIAKGLSKSQARGHPTSKEKHIKAPKPIPDDKLQISLQALRSGKSLQDAAKEIRVSPDRLRKQAKDKGAIRKHRGRWAVIKKLHRDMLIYSDGNALSITLSQPKQASKVGRYMSAVQSFMRTNNINYLKPFQDKFAIDSSGKSYTFETNPNALYRLASSGSDSFEQVYRIVI
jgi:hypothetical protein